MAVYLRESVNDVNVNKNCVTILQCDWIFFTLGSVKLFC